MKPFLFIFILLITFACSEKDKLTILHGPFVQHPADTAITIIWTTNKNAVSWVEVTPTDSSHLLHHKSRKYYPTEQGFKGPTKVHRIRINNLHAGTTYSYIVYSHPDASKFSSLHKDETVAAAYTNAYKPLKFNTTNTIKENHISFIAVNDIHERSGQLRKLLKKADYPSADFVFFNGDMVNSMKNEKQYFNGFMNTAIRMFANEKPLYYVRGNHETLGNYAPAFADYFNSPNGKLYYLLRRGPISFLIIDSGSYLDDQVINDMAEKQFDQYRDRECEWLKEAIKTKEFREAPFKVAVIHIPPIGTWHGAVEVASKFVPILNEANIDVMISGHLHRYFYRQPGNGINFPVVVNSNNTVIRAEADARLLTLKIINKTGQQVDLIKLKK